VSDQPKWSLDVPPRPAAIVGVFLLLAGVLLLVYPVSVSSYGLTSSCGTTITRDNSEATALDRRFGDTDAADRLGIPTPQDTDVSPITKCTDALVVRRWVAWPVTIVGALLAVVSLRIVLTDWFKSSSARTSASSRSSAAPQHDRETATASSVVPPAQQASGVGEGVVGSPPLPAAPPGWYNDPHSAQHIRWFDGTQWTAGTAPRNQASSPAAENDRGDKL
jgi:hypothetical protein